MGILSSGITDVGLVRKNNQDSIYMNPDRNVFIVADGMGGHKGGEVASKMAIDKMAQVFEEAKIEEPERLLKKSIKDANSSIFKRSQSDTNLKGMGTTVVSLYFKGSNLFVGNIGDSRAYLVNKNKLYQLTRDHSLVQEKLKIGLYTRQQAEDDPNKNVLARSCGINDQPEIDVFTYTVKRNDFFMICSDGLSGMVNDNDILQIVNEAMPNPGELSQEKLDEMVRTLIELAKKNGGQDNISVIAVLAY